MVSLTKYEKNKLKQILVKLKDKDAKGILRKINKEKKHKYVYDLKDIRVLLKKAHKEKLKVKIRYYSLSSDEVRWRTVSIYQFNPDFIVAYCHLRNGERTFVINRISQAAILDEDYKIPDGWKPESIVSSR